MKKLLPFLAILLLFISSQMYAQCSYNLINITHVDCYNNSSGSKFTKILKYMNELGRRIGFSRMANLRY